MIELGEGQFELDGAVFGGRHGAVIVRSFDPGTREVRAQDVDRPGADGLMFGVDYQRPPLWTWELSANRASHEAAIATVAALEGAWARWAPRTRPGHAEPLRYRFAGRTRRVYGRPRRFAAPDVGSVLMRQGRGDIVADFQLADPLHYDDVERSATLYSVPPSTGGIVAPLVAPISTTRAGDTAHRFITVGGDIETPLRVTFAGPITAPWVEVGGVRIALTGSVAYDQAVTVDARTRTVLRQDGASAAGMLTRRTRMDRLRLTPGTHEIRYGGTGQATVTVAWRDAWRTL